MYVLIKRVLKFRDGDDCEIMDVRIRGVATAKLILVSAGFPIQAPSISAILVVAIAY